MSAPMNNAFALTSAQKGIWLGQKLVGQHPRYNAAEYITLNGQIDYRQLSESLRLAINSATGLHVVFDQQREIQHPLQPNCRVEEKDFSHFTAPRSRATDWMKENLKHPLDAFRGQLYQVALLKLSSGEAIVYLKIHHIAADGYAFSLLAKAILDHYDNPQANSIEFGDYHKAVAEQALFEESRNYGQSQHYWENRLDEFRQPITFASQRGEIHDHTIKTSTRLPSGSKARLDSLGRLVTYGKSLAVSWSDVVMACVACLLAQRRACKQIVLGIPVMSRMGTSALKVPMMCMNIVPLSVRVDYQKPLACLMQAIAKQLKSDRPHHKFRYEQLRSTQRRHTGSHQASSLWGPVVNVLPFVRRTTFRGGQVNYHTLSAGPVEDISIAFALEGLDALSLTIEANASLYNEEDIAAITRDLLALLEDLEHAIGLPIEVKQEQFSWLAAEQFSESNFSPSNTGSKTPCDLWQGLVSTCQNQAHKIALRCDRKLLCYRELMDEAEQFAKQLIGAGIKPGQLCVLALPRGVNAVIASLACIKLRIAFLFLDPQAPIERNHYILRDSAPNLVIWDENTIIAGLSQMYPVVFLSQDRKLEYTGKPPAQNVAHQYDQCAYVIYTSGSTGTPKGVKVGYQALYEFVTSAVDRYDLLPSDRVLQFAPLHFDACIEEIFCTLYSGATLVLRNEAMLHSFDNFCDTCAAWNITVLDLPTAFWHELVNALHLKRVTLPNAIRSVIIGGEEAHSERLGQWLAAVGQHVTLFNSYGPTEATVVATVKSLTPANIDAPSLDASNIDTFRLNSIGQPLKGRAIAVIDEGGLPVRTGESGELILLGAGLAQGYINATDVTQQAFINIELPWLSESTRAYRTGDRVKVDQDRELIYLGRLDDEIKISGQRISPREIESSLLTLDGVQQAAIIVDKTAGSPRVIAHLVTEQDGHPLNDLVQLRRRLQDKLPAAMLPSQLHSHAHLPLTPSGKIDRKKLAQTPSLESSPSKANPVRFQPMVDCWKQVLGGERYSEDDDFFELGGQSLQVIQLASRLSEKLGRSVSAMVLFQHTSLKAMYEAVFETASTVDYQQQKRLIESDCQEFFDELSAINTHGNEPVKPKLNNVLLTGATGFVGAHILWALLQQTEAVVTCVVRTPKGENAQHKLAQQLRHFNLTINSEQFKRIRIIEADLANVTGQGLQQTLSRHLEDIDHVFHAAANTSVTRDYQSLRQINTIVTSELIKVCKLNNIAFRFISTIAVAPPRDVTGAIEARLTEDFIGFHRALSDGYQQSKWAAEKMCQIALEQGVDVRVYRLGRVCGALAGDYVNKSDLVWQIIFAGLQIAAMPQMAFAEPWTPADELADFIVADQNCRPTATAVMNLVPTHRVQFKQLLVWLQEQGYKFTKLDLTQWCARLKEQGGEEFLPLATFFEQKQYASEQGYELPLADAESHTCLARQKHLEMTFSEINQAAFNRFLENATGDLGRPQNSHYKESLCEV